MVYVEENPAYISSITIDEATLISNGKCSPLSEHQLRGKGCIIDSTNKKYGGSIKGCYCETEEA